jgi:aspartate racemase
MESKSAKHIGIVACSYEGAALCYKTICNEGSELLGRHAHPEVSLHTHPLSEYMVFVEQDDWKGVADLMVSTAKKLVNIGAEILICPDNTIHQALPMALEEIRTPWLHIAEEVLIEAAKHNYKNLAILGTKFLMEGPVYKEKCDQFGIGFNVPGKDERTRVNDIIFDELVYGIFKENSKKYLQQLIGDMKKNGCDAVVLGCTEIPLIIMPDDSELPILDSTRILSRAALKRSIAG